MKHRQRDQLAHYQALVRRYSAALDLLSPAGLERLDGFVEDALRYAELVPESPPRWLDLGSGAGLPGLPLAIALPDTAFTLVERRRRRAAFLSLAATQLQLTNTAVVANEVTTFRPEEKFAVISAQAVGSFTLVYHLTAHLQAATVTLIARKGEGWREEVVALEAALGLRVERSHELTLAGRGRLACVTVSGGQPCRP